MDSRTANHANAMDSPLTAIEEQVHALSVRGKGLDLTVRG